MEALGFFLYIEYHPAMRNGKGLGVNGERLCILLVHFKLPAT